MKEKKMKRKINGKRERKKRKEKESFLAWKLSGHKSLEKRISLWNLKLNSINTDVEQFNVQFGQSPRIL